MPLTRETINVLLVTYDLSGADYLTYELRTTAPNLRLEVSPGFRHASHRLMSGGLDAVLINHCISDEERSQLITYIHDRQLALPIILIFGPDVEDTMNKALKAGAEERIVKGPNFAKELPALIEKALVRYQSGIRHRTTKATASGAHTAKPEGPETESTAPMPEGAPASSKADSAAPQPLVTEGQVSSEEQAVSKRTSPRFEVHIPCRLCWQDIYYDACIHDLSAEGAFIETSALSPDGAMILICLKTSSTEVRVEATVLHRGWYMTDVRNFDGFGVRFKNLSPEEGELLGEMRRRSPQPALRKTTLIH